MPALEIEVSCCLCDAKTKHAVDMPEGWSHLYGAVDVEADGFCPLHSPVQAFADAQCPGCVSGWGECPLWQGFAYSRFTLTDEDMADIRRGTCPKRTNGTMEATPHEVEDLDISERASDESGEAFADAILDYVQSYGSAPPSR